MLETTDAGRPCGPLGGAAGPRWHPAGRAARWRPGGRPRRLRSAAAPRPARCTRARSSSGRTSPTARVIVERTLRTSRPTRYGCPVAQVHQGGQQPLAGQESPFSLRPDEGLPPAAEERDGPPQPEQHHQADKQRQHRPQLLVRRGARTPTRRRPKRNRPGAPLAPPGASAGLIVTTGWRQLAARREVGIMATRRLLHGHGLLPDLLEQRGQPGVLVAQPEQPEQ